MDNDPNLKEQILQLVAKNEIDQVFELLANRQFSALDKELILLNNRYNKLKEEIRMDVISKEDANREMNRITMALVELSTRVRQPVSEKPASTKKNNPLLYAVPLVLLAIGALIYYFGIAGSNSYADPEKGGIGQSGAGGTEIGPAPGQTSAEEARLWKRALSFNDLREYKTYLATFPKGAHADEAHQKIQVLGDQPYWEMILEQNAIGPYKDYLAEFPNGQFRSVAMDSIRVIEAREKRIQQDNLDFEAAAKLETIEAFQTYLSQHPNGQFVGLAKANIRAMEADKECLCAKRTFRQDSDHTWVKFEMPQSKMGTTIKIPEGVYNKYVFPKCNRVWWTNLVFTCNPNTCQWEKVSGRYDSDALCHGGYTEHRYLVVGTK
jgi:hypothetical protein